MRDGADEDISIEAVHKIAHTIPHVDEWFDPISSVEYAISLQNAENKVGCSGSNLITRSMVATKSIPQVHPRESRILFRSHCLSPPLRQKAILRQSKL